MFNILLIILKNKKYATIAALTAIGIGALSYYLTVVNVYRHSPLVYAEMNGAAFAITSFILGAVIAILLGGHIALLVFRRDIIRSRLVGNKVAGLGGGAI